MDVELNVELTSAPRSTTGNIAYMVQLAALHTRYEFHVLFPVEPSSVFTELSDEKSTFFSLTETCAKSKLQNIQRERMTYCILPIRQEVRLYFPKIRVRLA